MTIPQSAYADSSLYSGGANMSLRSMNKVFFENFHSKFTLCVSQNKAGERSERSLPLRSAAGLTKTKNKTPMKSGFDFIGEVVTNRLYRTHELCRLNIWRQSGTRFGQQVLWFYLRCNPFVLPAGAPCWRQSGTRFGHRGSRFYPRCNPFEVAAGPPRSPQKAATGFGGEQPPKAVK